MIEVLAPCGSKQSFIAAVRAGADAVYIGAEGFNARQSAHNLSVYDLEVMTAHARNNNVKVYTALNILIKHSEINDVVKVIEKMTAFSPDGIIVQDLGIARIVKDCFPGLPLHASTQMAVHNSMGVETLKDLGFKRVVLARELTFSEIKTVSARSSIETEIFCHGALCFSVSGMCLFSSYLSGLSGNRGRCAQPCRRLWKQEGQKGYLFSPKDYQLAQFIKKIKTTKVKSLKIEGRMRSSAYVYRVVKAYKMLVTAKDSDYELVEKEALELLNSDMAREKTTFVFTGRDREIIQPEKMQTMGKNIGKVVSCSGDTIKLELKEKINEGDYLRIAEPSKDKTVNIKVKQLKISANTASIVFEKADFSGGEIVFRITDVESDEKKLEEEIDSIYAQYKGKRSSSRVEHSQGYTSLISSEWKQKSAGRECLWVKINDLKWLDIVKEPGINIVYSMDISNRYELLNHIRNSGRINNLYVELTPYMHERELHDWKKFIDELLESGVNSWVVDNLSHLKFFSGSGAELVSGPFLYMMNAYSARQLKDMNIKMFMASWEEDFMNLSDMARIGLGKDIIVLLYGYPQIVRSKMLEKETISEGKTITGTAEDDKNAFITGYESESFVLYPDKPVSAFNFRPKLFERGITNFAIDLACDKPSKAAWMDIYTSYMNCENREGTNRFNMKLGLK